MRRRRAFTLVEMLVSVALVLFIMVILSEAFVAGLETFRVLKAIGDMEERLRATTRVIRNDLAADHFEGKRRLSDPDFWLTGPPREGFFRIWQGQPVLPPPPNVPPPLDSMPQPIFVDNPLTREGRLREGDDGDRIPSYAAVTHALHFTVKLRGNRRENFFSALVPPEALQVPGSGAQSWIGLLASGTHLAGEAYPEASRFQDVTAAPVFTSQWAEIALFLRPLVDRNGNVVTAQGTQGGATPLFGLYRRQLLLVPDTRQVNFRHPADPNQLPPTSIPVPRPLDLLGYLRGFSELSVRKRDPDYAAASLSSPYPNPPTQPPGWGDTLYFNNPTDVTVPQRRFGMDPTAAPTAFGAGPLGTGPTAAGWPVRRTVGLDMISPYPVLGDPEPTTAPPLIPPAFAGLAPLLGQNPSRVPEDDPDTGKDLLLSDVISMDVSVLPAGFTQFVTLFDPALYTNPEVGNNPVFFHPNPAFGIRRFRPAVFDTWSSVQDAEYNYSNWRTATDATRVPMPIRLLAIKITLRVWDSKTQQARQVTLVQDL